MKLHKYSKYRLLLRKGVEYFKQLFNPVGRVANTKVSIPDARDYVMSDTPTIQVSSYRIPVLPPVRNQLNIGSCRSHTAIASYETQLLNQGYDFDGSELYHYYMARKYITNTFPRDTGMSMRDGCKVSLEYGTCPEAFHPYVTANFNKEPAEYTHSWAQFLRIARYERLTTPEQIKVRILQNIPVQIGIFLDDSYYNLRHSNWVWSPKTRGNKGGHAVMIVGFNEEGFIVRNSWGFWWGRQGEFLIPYDKMQQHSFDWYVEIV
jgi:C1A family cysteine protease